MRDLYLYRVEVQRVVDGDTIKIAGVDLGFGVKAFTHRGRTKTGRKRYYSIRLRGVNTEETRRGWWSKNLAESTIERRIAKGKKAKEYVTDLVNRAERVFIRSYRAGPDNFGRLLGDVVLEFADGQVMELGEHLLEEGMARPYKD